MQRLQHRLWFKIAILRKPKRRMGTCISRKGFGSGMPSLFCSYIRDAGSDTQQNTPSMVKHPLLFPHAVRSCWGKPTILRNKTTFLPKTQILRNIPLPSVSSPPHQYRRAPWQRTRCGFVVGLGLWGSLPRHVEFPTVFEFIDVNM